jgi:diguanylate cyclase (GGDEF)-like protein
VELVARYGGEEFAILMRGCELAQARHLAEQARLSVADMRIAHPASPVGYVTASFGLACREALTVDVEGLIYAADQALYQSKKQGRNRVSVAP